MERFTSVSFHVLSCLRSCPQYAKGFLIAVVSNEFSPLFKCAVASLEEEEDVSVRPSGASHGLLLFRISFLFFQLMRGETKV